MRFALAALLIAHGVAHLVGFVVPWRLVSTAEVPYRTTIFGGATDLGDAGARALGVVWLVAALAFVVLAGAVLAGSNVRLWTFAMLVSSIVLCVVGWPEARLGLVVNVVLLTELLAMPGLAARSFADRAPLNSACVSLSPGRPLSGNRGPQALP